MSKKPKPTDPVACRPSNVDSMPEPKKSYRKALAKTPHEHKMRVESFRRNRERIMREKVRTSNIVGAMDRITQYFKNKSVG